MASRETLFGRTEEGIEEDDSNHYERQKSYMENVQEIFRVSQKQSAWIEDEVTGSASTRRRERFTSGNIDRTLSKDSVESLSPSVNVQKVKKRRKNAKKKGKVKEKGSKLAPLMLEGEEKGGGDKRHPLASSMMLHPPKNNHQDDFQRQQRQQTSLSTIATVDNLEMGFAESEYGDSFTLHSTVSTPTAQRQSVSWSPSPVPKIKDLNKLQPLPEMAEELIHRKLQMLKEVNVRSTCTRDIELAEMDVSMKKKKRKKAGARHAVASSQQEEETNLNNDFVSWPSFDKQPDLFPLKERNAKIKSKKLGRCVTSDVVVESKECRMSKGDSSGSDSIISGGTYSISPKRDIKEDWEKDTTESDSVVDQEEEIREEVRKGKRGEKTNEGTQLEKREGSSNRKLVTMEHLGLGGEHSVWWEISSSPSPLWSKEEALASEGGVLFHPSSIRAPLKERLPPDFHEPSFVGGDELIPVKHLVSNENLARLENRILAEGCRRWFGEDGEVIGFSNPIRYNSLRPPQIIRLRSNDPSWNIHHALYTEYRPALVGAYGEGYENDLYEVIDGAKESSGSKKRKGCLLEVELISLEFEHHPLFSNEHVLAQRLVSLWTEWESRRKAGKAKLLTEQVERLRAEKQQLIDDLKRTRTKGGDSYTDEIDELEGRFFEGQTSIRICDSVIGSSVERLLFKMEELKRCRMDRDSEGKRDRKTLESVLIAWRDLKALRKEQGFAVTSLHLHIHTESTLCSRKGDKTQWGIIGDGSAAEESRRERRAIGKTEEGGTKVKDEGKSKEACEGPSQEVKEEIRTIGGNGGRLEAIGGNSGRLEASVASKRSEIAKKSQKKRNFSKTETERATNSKSETADFGNEIDYGCHESDSKRAEILEGREEETTREKSERDIEIRRIKRNSIDVPAEHVSDENILFGKDCSMVDVVASCGNGEKRKASSRERRRQRLGLIAELAKVVVSGRGITEKEGGKVPVPAPRTKANGKSSEKEDLRRDGMTEERDALALEWKEWEMEVEREVEELMEEARWEMQARNLTMEEPKEESVDDKKSVRVKQKRESENSKGLLKLKKKRKDELEKRKLICSRSNEEVDDTKHEDEYKEDSNSDIQDVDKVIVSSPDRVDCRVVRFQVEEMMKASRRHPGEPLITLRLLKDELTNNGKFPCSREKERKFNVELTEIQARILYNGKEACRSKAVPLTQMFSPSLDHSFAIRALGPPSSLALELYERVRGHSSSSIGTEFGGWYPIALIDLPIPSSNTTLHEETLPERIQFGNDKVVAYQHSGVGSGIFFSPFPEKMDTIPMCLYLSGSIWCRLGWGVNQNGVILSPRRHYSAGQSEEEIKILEELEDVGKLLLMFHKGDRCSWWNTSKNGNVEKLWQLAEEVKNKNAPSRTKDEIFQMIGEWSASRLNKWNSFYLDPLMEEYHFVSNFSWIMRKEFPASYKRTREQVGEHWWNLSKRLLVLCLRDKGVPVFRGLRWVPLNDREIPTDIFQVYQDKISSQGTCYFALQDNLSSRLSESITLSQQSRQKGQKMDVAKGESGGLDPHEVRREWGCKFLQKARHGLLQQSHLASKQQRRLSDMVVEEQMPTVGSLGITLLEWLKPKRPLKPVRRSWLLGCPSGLARGTGGTKAPASSIAREVKIKVNVVRAFGVPMRHDIDPITDSSPWHSSNLSSQVWHQDHHQAQSDYELAEIPVQPFVEVVLGTARARTTTALGVNPTWNQELNLSLNLESSIFERTRNNKISSILGGVLDSSLEDLNTSTWWTSNGDLNPVDDLCLSIFLKDETLVDLLVDSRAREEGEIHQRTQQHFLASLRIPLSTLHRNNKLEGTFRLSSPPVLLGYASEESALGGGQHWQALGSSSQVLPAISCMAGLQPGSIYLTLFISVETPFPVQEISFKDDHALESIELPHVESHLRTWEIEVANTIEHSFCPPRALVPDLGGRTVCITRFFRPIAPPQGLPLATGSNTPADWLARYVSMIPLSNGHQMIDIWLNSEQMLGLLCGSRVDHATFLVCLFMHLGLTAWLAQGSGLPDGPNCSFVLTRGCGKKLSRKEDEGKKSEDERNTPMKWRDNDEDGSEDYEIEDDFDWWIWDPITGQRFNIRDPFCPLQHLCYLINDQNIWANVQGIDQPQRMNFNLEVRSDWWPAFSQDSPPGRFNFSKLISPLLSWFSGFNSTSGIQIQSPLPAVGSVQPESLPYHSGDLKAFGKKGAKRKGGKDIDCLKLLEERLEDHLQSCFMHWRKNKTTLWNRHGSTLLRKLLPQLEHPTVLGYANPLDENHLCELKSIMASHKMCGFPINIPYCGFGSAREALRTTGIYNMDEPGVEFALAVYLHPYSGIKGETSSILSLWVYVASLVNRKFNLD